MNSIAVLKTKPAMPMAVKFSDKIRSYVGDDGTVMQRHVHAGTPLIPAPDATVIVQELTKALEACSPTHALVFAKQLIGCYRRVDVIDPDIYIASMAAKFEKFPADIGAKIVDTLTDRLKWTPTGADVMEAGSQFKREREAALRTARKHIEEHERRIRRAKEAEDLAAECEGREASLKKLYTEKKMDWPGYGKASWAKVAVAGIKIVEGAS